MRTAPMLAALLAVACGPPDGVPEPGHRARVALSVAQSAVEAQVATAVSVTAVAVASGATALSGGDPQPVPGMLVTFHVALGGGSVYSGAAVTGQDGSVRDAWTLGPYAGAQRLEVRAVDQATGEPLDLASVDATALAGPPESWTASPSNVEYAPGESWDSSGLRLLGWDGYGNPAGQSSDYQLQMVSFDGSYTGEPRPQCLVEGTLIRCPQTDTWQPGAAAYHSGVFVARFVSGTMTFGPAVRITVR